MIFLITRMSIMKRCCKCKIEKSFDEFGYRNSERKTLTSECKECVRNRSREHFKNNREKYNAKRTKYYQDNKEQELKKCKEYYESNRERIRKRANELSKKPERRKKAREYSKIWIEKNRDKLRKNALRQNKMNPQKYEARRPIYMGVKYGFITKPKICEICKLEKKIEAHHLDYNQPLNVRWLCTLCHFHQHDKMIDVKNEGIL